MASRDLRRIEELPRQRDHAIDEIRLDQSLTLNGGLARMKSTLGSG
jgi:hypothetical protein